MLLKNFLASFKSRTGTRLRIWKGFYDNYNLTFNIKNLEYMKNKLLANYHYLSLFYDETKTSLVMNVKEYGRCLVSVSGLFLRRELINPEFKVMLVFTIHPFNKKITALRFVVN